MSCTSPFVEKKVKAMYLLFLVRFSVLVFYVIRSVQYTKEVDQLLVRFFWAVLVFLNIKYFFYANLVPRVSHLKYDERSWARVCFHASLSKGNSKKLGKCLSTTRYTA